MNKDGLKLTEAIPNGATLPMFRYRLVPFYNASPVVSLAVFSQYLEIGIPKAAKLGLSSGYLIENIVVVPEASIDGPIYSTLTCDEVNLRLDIVGNPGKYGC